MPSGESHDVRDDILSAAERLINEVGIAGFRVGALAERVGCTRQNLYRYFATKDELISAVLLRRSRRLGAHIARRVRGIRDPEEALVEGLAEGIEVARRDHSLRSYYEGASAPKMIGFVANSKGLLETAVRMLDPFFDQAESWIRPELTREDVAEWLFRMFINELIWSSTVRRTRAQRREFLRKMVLPALRDPARPRRRR